VKHKIILTSVAFVIAVTASGCAPRIGASNVSVQGAGRMSETLRGVIVAARPVTISARSAETDNQPGAGAVIGGLSGAILGSQIGGGRGRAVTGVLGALGAGVAGHMIEQKLTDQEGMEYQIQLDRGGLITMRQGADPILQAGQRVMVINASGGHGRVIPDNS
jgi:outer membrane lipoprotein SlyB